MIRIVKKQRVPTIFEQIKNRRSDYDELFSSEKDEIKKILLEEQGYKCAYCMSKISMSNSTIEHYEGERQLSSARASGGRCSL